MAQPTPAQRMEQVIRAYIQACNDADAEAIAACFCPDAVHYFPPPLLKWSGAATIGSNFATRVREHGISYTVDQFLIDVDRHAVALEWTMFMQKPAALVRRGLEWYAFESQTWRIQEIRGYTAAPLDSGLNRQEFLDFDYSARGYPTAHPCYPRQ
jgi:methyltransferase